MNKITDYDRSDFLKMTVEITYARHEKRYSVSVPVEGNKVRGKTLTQEEKGSLYDSLLAASA